MIKVAESIQADAEQFFADLLTAAKGFYFLEADQCQDQLYLRAYDYRNSSPTGISLILAAEVTDEATFIQATGRVRRGGDEGKVFRLPKCMWKE